MPFQEMSRMQARQKLAFLVMEQGWSIARAARHMGVSRPTAHLWVQRARQHGLEHLQEESRRPHQVAGAMPQTLCEQVLQLKAQHPAWGAKKLHAVLWPAPQQAPVCVRTLDRLLKRQGLVRPRGEGAGAPLRFERTRCNELWQLDFKGLEACWGYYPLSVLDDHSRFCLALHPLAARDTHTVWQVLWQVFEEYGLPECILCDNGDGFNSTQSLGPTRFQAWLWRLGVRTCHGRVRHPQTQGKVERFHRTLEDEWAQALRQPSVQVAQQAWLQVRQEYNWVRPHEALGQQVPGSRYQASLRRCPEVLPEPFVSADGVVRKVDGYGKFSYRGQVYRAGRGLAGEWVEIREPVEPIEPKESVASFGAGVFYHDRLIAPLSHLKV